jgi:hypothetical protein
MRGAGGSEGGIGRFIIGVIMILGGGYLFLNSIIVTSGFRLGFGLYRFGGISITTGMILIPFIFGICFIFYNAKNATGWLLSGASLIMLVFGVISSVHITLKNMSIFDLIIIFVFFFGGIGLFLSSLKKYRSEEKQLPENEKQ